MEVNKFLDQQRKYIIAVNLWQGNIAVTDTKRRWLLFFLFLSRLHMKVYC